MPRWFIAIIIRDPWVPALAQTIALETVVNFNIASCVCVWQQNQDQPAAPAITWKTTTSTTSHKKDTFCFTVIFTFLPKDGKTYYMHA